MNVSPKFTPRYFGLAHEEIDRSSTVTLTIRFSVFKVKRKDAVLDELSFSFHSLKYVLSCHVLNTGFSNTFEFFVSYELMLN